MKDFKTMSAEEQQKTIDQMLAKMTPENRAKAELKYLELLHDQKVSKNRGGRPRKDNLSTTTPPANNRYYTVNEAVELLGVHRHTLQSKLRDGVIKGKLLSKEWRIYRDAIFDNSPFFYYFECEDANYTDRYWSPVELSKLVSGNAAPMREGDIIALAKNIEATLYRYTRSSQKGSETFRNGVMIYDSEIA